MSLRIVTTIAEERAAGVSVMSPCADLGQVKTLICGHSNSHAISRATTLVGQGEAEPAIVGQARLAGMGGLVGYAGEPGYFEAVRELGASRHVAIVWQGDRPSAHFLFMPGPPFDVVPRNYAVASVEPGAILVPEAMIRSVYAPDLADLDALLKQLGRPAGLKRVVVGIQPPLQSEALIRGRLSSEDGFAERVARLGFDLGTIPITPASVRLKLWFVLQEQMRELAEQNGALFLASPAGACDEQGFLKPALAAHDATHANLAYGRLVVRDLIALLA